MTGPAESKIEIPAKVYIHKRDPLTRSKIPHIDIESPILNQIIKPNESTYASGKEGGVFIGLKREMLARLEHLLGELEK
ncbi:MAG: hypothetical protein ACP5PX_02525 [Candidatus Hadarchaeum sp.]|uniref:hypothetical protein n=1 Tax=Candidatus Hadarchaeum sp. TaxID=2883567 RepID=UPI003D09F858